MQNEIVIGVEGIMRILIGLSTLVILSQTALQWRTMPSQLRRMKVAVILALSIQNLLSLDWAGFISIPSFAHPILLAGAIAVLFWGLLGNPLVTQSNPLQPDE